MKKKKIKFIRLFMIIFIAYTVVTLINQQVKIVNAKKENTALQNKIDEVAKDNERLKATLQNIASAEYLEKTAREQLGLVKPGERVYIDQPMQQAAPKEDDNQQSQ